MEDRSLKQVQLSRHTEELLAYYRELFAKLFGSEPFIEEDDRTVAAWMCQAMDQKKAKMLLSLYLVMDNQWLRDQGYPLRLLKKNINAIIVKHAPIVEMEKASAISHREMVIDYGCDSCWKLMTITLPVNYDFNAQLTRCQECEEKDRPLKRVPHARLTQPLNEVLW